MLVKTFFISSLVIWEDMKFLFTLEVKSHPSQYNMLIVDVNCPWYFIFDIVQVQATALITPCLISVGGWVRSSRSTALSSAGPPPSPRPPSTRSPSGRRTPGLLTRHTGEIVGHTVCYNSSHDVLIHTIFFSQYELYQTISLQLVPHHLRPPISPATSTLFSITDINQTCWTKKAFQPTANCSAELQTLDLEVTTRTCQEISRHLEKARLWLVVRHIFTNIKYLHFLHQGQGRYHWVWLIY